MQRPEFLVPDSLTEALLLMADPQNPTLVVGGGTMILPQQRLAPRASRMIDVGLLSELSRIDRTEAGVEIGSAVTYSMLLEASRGRVPALLTKLASSITGGPQIRNQGTLGGSSCFANPSSDLPTAMVASGAHLKITSHQRGIRTVSAHEFFLGAFRTALLPDELLTAICFPAAAFEGRWGYVKLKMAESSWPIAVAAAHITDNGDERRTNTRITIGAACEVPFALSGLLFSSPIGMADPTEEDAMIRAAIDSAPVAWWADEFTDARYRRRLACVAAFDAVMAAREAED